MNSSTPPYFSEAQMDFAASPAAVWAVLGDFHGLGKWSRGVRAQPLGSAQQGVGAGRRCEIPGLGTVDEVVFQWEPEQRLSYTVTPVSVFGPGIARWRLEALGPQKTRVTERFEYGMRFGVLGALLRVLIVKRKLAQAQPQILKMLKKKVEAGAV
ncbi:MAG: SRPBCC family protein [Nevskiales bacterium]